MFQYNYCFGGTNFFNLLRWMFLCFNTTIVSVELSFALLSSSIKRFQYNYCFGGTLQVYYRLFYKPVSIQLLFRWNLEEMHFLKLWKTSFNTTIVSVELAFSGSFSLFITLFQYNYCFGGTKSKVLIPNTPKPFQYNYCFGGTIDTKYNPDTGA